MSWVYVPSGPPDNLYTVGYYAPDGKFHPDSDWEDIDDAARRIHYLNGGDGCQSWATYRIVPSVAEPFMPDLDPDDIDGPSFDDPPDEPRRH